MLGFGSIAESPLSALPDAVQAAITGSVTVDPGAPSIDATGNVVASAAAPAPPMVVGFGGVGPIPRRPKRKATPRTRTPRPRTPQPRRPRPRRPLTIVATTVMIEGAPSLAASGVVMQPPAIV